MRELNILLCFDRNFTLPVGALIISIIENHPNHRAVFHIFCPEAEKLLISKELESRLSRHKHASRMVLEFYSYETAPLFNQLINKVNKRVLNVCARLTSVRFCNTTSPNLIYLDSDMICTGDLSELADVDLGDHVLGVTKSAPGTKRTKIGDKYDIKDYFIAGTLVFNRQKWLANDYDRDCIDFILKENPQFYDQDALNVLFRGQCLYLSNKYQRYKSYDKETRIIHYAGEKPWEPRFFSVRPELIKIYRKYAKQFEPDVTKWVSFNPKRYALIDFSASRPQTKWLSKKLFRQKKYKGALFFLIKHTIIKIKAKGILGTLLFRSNTCS